MYSLQLLPYCVSYNKRQRYYMLLEPIYKEIYDFS